MNREMETERESEGGGEGERGGEGAEEEASLLNQEQGVERGRIWTKITEEVLAALFAVQVRPVPFAMPTARPTRSPMQPTTLPAEAFMPPQSSIPHNSNSFELYGFDVLISRSQRVTGALESSNHRSLLRPRPHSLPSLSLQMAPAPPLPQPISPLQRFRHISSPQNLFLGNDRGLPFFFPCASELPLGSSGVVA